MLRYALDLVVALAALAIVVCVALTLASCASPTAQEPIARRISASVWEGWAGATPALPEMDEERLHTDRFEVRFPDVAEFNRLCAPAVAGKAYACFRWLLVKHKAMKLYSISKPVALIGPILPEGAYVEGLAIHELLHGVVSRTLRRPQGDPYDYFHTDPRVWGKAPTTAESVARASLGMSPDVQNQMQRLCAMSN
jgi:hypothetical protein